MIPAQSVTLIEDQSEPIFAESPTHLPPIPDEVLQEQTKALIDQMQEWFATFPKSNLPQVDLREILLLDRADSFKVRDATSDLPNGTEVDAETIYFPSSPEIWLVRFFHNGPELPQYSVYSWQDHQVPLTLHLSDQGKIVGGTQTPETYPVSQLEYLVETCAAKMEQQDVEASIQGTPAFRSREILDSLQEHQWELSLGTLSIIPKIPKKIAEAMIRGEKSVELGVVGPFNRHDLTFYKDGKLQMDAVREAIPTLMEVHDIIKSHGFSPVLRAEQIGAEKTIPVFTLFVPTRESAKLIEMKTSPRTQNEQS